VMRLTLNLETSKKGLYTTDIMFTVIDEKIQYATYNAAYTPKNCFILVREIRNYELMIHDVLQYYEYFIRPKFHQKPDIEGASEKYKLLADDMTVQQLRQVVGSQNEISSEKLESVAELESETPDELEDESDSFDAVATT